MRRLTFAFRDGAITLLSDHVVDMIPSTPPASASPRFWYELRDGAANVRRRIAARDPLPSDTEVFTGDPKRPIERVPRPPSRGVFTVVVPDDDGVEEIALMRAAAPADRAAPAAESAAQPIELARFSLRKGG